MKKRLTTVILLSVSLLSILPAAGAAQEARSLPLLASLAEGRELPLPFGVSALYYWQDHSYDLDSLAVSSPFLPMLANLSQALDPSTIDVDNEVTQVGVKVDAWLLPFLNVYALAGRIDGETDVDLGGNPAAAQLGLRELSVDYDGFVYGVGGTLTWGVDPVFAALNGVITWTDLDEETDVRAYVLRPIVGVRVERLALWTGAMYQKAEEDHEGEIILPNLGAVDYDIELEEKDPWNWLVGVSYDITPNWSLEAECGFGDRTQVEASVTYRF